ncbi:MAG: family 14 glycosylhydrolase [Clostridia bacterium]|nr:family 14 glycosylhydrolase [Clostridia bacterium]
MSTKRKTDTPRTDVSDAYQIHNDRGMIYNPLSRDRLKNGYKSYADVPHYEGKLEIESGSVIYFNLPTEFTAYDMVPIEYTFYNPSCDQRESRVTYDTLHFLATGLEDIDRKNGKEFYSNILPGTIKVDFDYLGYVTAENHAERRALHHGNFENDRQATKYPHFDATDLTASGVMPNSDYFWLKFHYKNTGDTILSVNGNGTFCFEPILQKLDENGNWVHHRAQNNLFIRLLDDLYPGEEGDMYVSFDHAENIGVGKYRVIINCLVRNETANPENFVTNIWGGRTYETAYFEFDIEDTFRQVEPKEITYTYKLETQRNTWLHTYEEFMTSFDSWLNPFEIDPVRTGKQVMYLQCGPWTNCITLKLMSGNAMNQVAVSIPVKVETDSIKVKLDTEHMNYIIDDEGKRQPAVIAQSMCDMRVHVALGPEADQTVLNELIDMKDCGVNLISTTAAFETVLTPADSEFITRDTPPISNHNSDAHWFMCDAIKQLGMKLEGWITYPYDSKANVAKARWITGDDKYDPNKITSVDDPLLAEACGIKTEYQFKRWGDNYFVMGDGKVPVLAEDTRGWHRIDIQNRHPMDAQTKESFREYVKEKYGTIEDVNAVWGTNYADFASIDPEEGTFIDHGHPSYTTEDAVFTEWSRPLEDLDVFRTASRMGNYQTILDMNSDLFNGIVGMRTEGGNWTAEVPYDSGNQRYRHVYYSQRRVAAMPRQMADTGIVCIHSDYCTLPYSPEEVADLTRRSMDMGIMPMHMIQADRMRDVAINPHYGQDYTIRYNLGEKANRGAYISTVISLFGWFKATYENGGIPGVLWEDYLCDGYVTAMQQKEMKFFKEKLQEALNTPEGKAWQEANTVDAKAAVSKSLGVNSFDPDYVASLIAKCEANRK